VLDRLKDRSDAAELLALLRVGDGEIVGRPGDTSISPAVIAHRAGGAPAPLLEAIRSRPAAP
jgi:hypothetical protein